jgi:hypothetical protein
LANRATSAVATVLRLLLLSVGLLLLGIILGLFGWDYAQFTDYILALASRQDMRDYWTAKILPESRFLYLRVAVLLAFGLYFGLSFLLWRRVLHSAATIVAMGEYCGAKMREIRADLGAQPIYLRLAIGFFFLLILLRSGFNAWFYELQYDEAWTYNNFVHKGAIISAISPHNNHILYTILAAVANFLPISGKYILRLPVILGGMLTLWFWLLMWGRFLGWRAAFLMVLCLSVAPPMLFYMLYARGYVFMFAAAVVQVWVLINLLTSPAQNSDSIAQKTKFWLLILAQVLGLYSVPTYIYVWVVANLSFLVFFWRQALPKSLFWGWIKAQIYAVGLLAILYAPFLLTGGLSILFSAATGANPDVYTYAEHWRLYQKLSDWQFFGADTLQSGWLTLFLAAVALWAAVRAGDLRLRYWYLFSALLLLLPLGLFFMQPLRVWSPQVLAYAFLLGQFLRLFSPKYAYFLAFLLLPLWQWQSYRHYEINWSADIDRTALKIADLLATQRIDELYIFSRYDKPLLQYYHLRRQNTPLRTAMPYRESIDYAPFDARIYAAVLLDIEDYTPTPDDWAQLQKANYRLVYADWRLRLYVSEMKNEE